MHRRDAVVVHSLTWYSQDTVATRKPDHGRVEGVAPDPAVNLLADHDGHDHAGQTPTRAPGEAMTWRMSRPMNAPWPFIAVIGLAENNLDRVLDGEARSGAKARRPRDPAAWNIQPSIPSSSKAIRIQPEKNQGPAPSPAAPRPPWPGKRPRTPAAGASAK